MSKTHISIVTGSGGELGTGHLQRMANLADFLNRKTSIRALIVWKQTPELLPAHLRDFLSEDVVPGSACIIRDMRDSTIKDMLALKEHGPVLAVDDCGPGRDRADLAIDLLPNLNHSISHRGPFIYGYNFTDSVRRLGSKRVDKTIDITMYAGAVPDERTIDSLLSLLPDQCSCALFAGERSRMTTNGTSARLTLAYAEALLSSKVLVSHFGITLYEGHLAGCRLVSVNPTRYHSRLADTAKQEIEITNLGILAEADKHVAQSTLASAAQHPLLASTSPSDLLVTVEKGLEEFHQQILILIQQ